MDRARERDYYTGRKDDFLFHPPSITPRKQLPTGDEATRMRMLHEWALARFDADDTRVFGGEGMTAYSRWLRLEYVYASVGENDLDLPGEAPLKQIEESGLI